MIKQCNNAGLTLTELIVSSMLIGIVISGVTAFSFALKETERSTSKSSLLAMKTAAAMSMMKKDIEAAVGSYDNRGVLSFSGGGEASVCLRHDTDGNPMDYTNDNWRCYFNATNYTIYRCPYKTTTPTNITTSSCAGTGTEMVNFVPGLWPGTSNWVNFQPVNYPSDTTLRLDYVLLILNTGKYDASAPYDPLDQPYTVLRAQIAPINHSW